jgi:hypothetical protein
VISGETVALTLDPPEIGANGAVTVSGQGEPGTAVEVLVDDEPVGAAPVSSRGAWVLATQLDPGDYQLVARPVGGTEVTLTVASAISLTVPAAPIQTTVNAPQIGTGGVFTLTGTGDPGSTLEVMTGNLSLGTVTVDADGAWSLTKKVEPGQYRLQVREPGAASIAASAPGITVTLPVEAAVLAVAKPQIGSNGVITLTGTGTPGKRVEIVQDGKVVGVATVSDQGAWSLLYKVGENGRYGFAVQQSDDQTTRTEPVTINVTNIIIAPPTPAAAVAATAEPTATVEAGAAGEVAAVPETDSDLSAEAQPVADSLGGEAYIVQPGDNLSSLADEYLGSPQLFTEIVAATNATVNTART